MFQTKHLNLENILDQNILQTKDKKFTEDLFLSVTKKDQRNFIKGGI